MWSPCNESSWWPRIYLHTKYQQYSLLKIEHVVPFVAIATEDGVIHSLLEGCYSGWSSLSGDWASTAGTVVNPRGQLNGENRIVPVPVRA